ncbi:hypothetical protein EDB82DRAFT_477220 [Fusarium venenatum]|uniref:uncharacterized protein n=1 Tax=Fusarium venenatum TaxID=56646 RepID=UPI001D5E7202|nr:hypothetical protein EDB82DRAFT_477220 [Fusarium venenatum]
MDGEECDSTKTRRSGEAFAHPRALRKLISGLAHGDSKYRANRMSSMANSTIMTAMSIREEIGPFETKYLLSPFVRHALQHDTRAQDNYYNFQPSKLASISRPVLAIRETTIWYTDGSSAASSARQCEAYLLQLPSLSCWEGWPTNYQTATRPHNVQTNIVRGTHHWLTSPPIIGAIDIGCRTRDTCTWKHRESALRTFLGDMTSKNLVHPAHHQT